MSSSPPLYALPVAVRALLHGYTEAEAAEYLRLCMEGRDGVRRDVSQADETTLLEAILGSTLRVDSDGGNGDGRVDRVYRELSVGQILDKGHRTKASEGELEALAARGVKPVNGGTAIFIHPPTVCRYLLRGTDWADLNIGDILVRLRGAQRDRNLRLAGKQTKGIVIPLDTDTDNECEQERMAPAAKDIL